MKLEYKSEEITERNRKQKLVRDNDLMLMTKQKKNFTYHTATAEEHKISLRNKLIEEAEEHAANPKPEELIDVLEVIHALAKTYNLTIEQLDKLRKAKRDFRGGFNQGIILEKWK